MAAQLEKYESRIRLELIKLLFLFCEHHNDPLALTPYPRYADTGCSARKDMKSSSGGSFWTIRKHFFRSPRKQP